MQLIEDFRPDLIMATPSYMLTVIDEMERQGIDPRFTSLKVGIFGAEPWTNDMRREMEARLDMHAVDIYGLSEVIGPGVANECVETKDGLHVWEDHFYLSPHFQCVLDRTGNLDSLTVVVEQREGVALDRAENAGTLLRRLVKKLDRRLDRRSRGEPRHRRALGRQDASDRRQPSRSLSARGLLACLAVAPTTAPLPGTPGTDPTAPPVYYFTLPLLTNFTSALHGIAFEGMSWAYVYASSQFVLVIVLTTY